MFDRSDRPGPATTTAPGDGGDGSTTPAADSHDRSPAADLHDVLTHARDAEAAARALGASTSGLLRSAQDVIERQVQERPWTAMGVAAGVGFVVAGGLATPAARAAMRMGSRAVLGLVLREVLLAAPPEADDEQNHMP